ncbi:DNA mismatch repair protein Msh2p [[Candida] jaroonii]|uniref:DNA mismatch repair protein Msh2p n=1 Tax=[Candida] jaroonii TaxID=467808 RepID=A0ACA9YAG4_9ASCO|nr:DNA mismatch repair protein Msh2p [[Candida] jaroonii]
MSSTRPDLKFSDNLEERKYYNKYSQLPNKSSNTIRFTDHNNKDYFTALDEDADLIADNIYKTQSVIKYNQNKKNRYVTISPQVFLNNALKFCLIENTFKVEIYDKNFNLIVMGSPGNLENLSQHYNVDLENMFVDGSSPITAAIKFTSQGNNKKVGICLINLSNNLIQVSEFEDNEIFSNLESLLIQLGVKEVLLPSNYDPEAKEMSDVNKLCQILDKIGIIVSSLKSSVFTASNIEQDLIKLLSKDEDNLELILGSKGIDSNDYQLSFACCNALITYLSLLNEDIESNEIKHFTIEKYDLMNYMKLDSSTLNALNIFPNKQSNLNIKNNQVSSIFELLNKCKTTNGSRLLSQWLKQPLTRLNLIEERQTLVEKLINDTSLRLFLIEEVLAFIPDIKRLLKKINNNIKKTGNDNKKLEDVIRLYQLFLLLPKLIEMLQMAINESKDDNPELSDLINKYWLEPINDNYEKLTKFQGLVETAIDLSPLNSNDLTSDFNINPDFENSLTDINNQLISKEQEIKNQHIMVAEDLGIDIEKKLKLEKHQIHNWCFRVTRNDSGVLRNTSYRELQTVKAGVFFTNSELTQLSREHQQILDEYNLRQREIIQEILLVTLTFESIFTGLSISLCHLDVIQSFAQVSILSSIQYTKPQLLPLAETSKDKEFDERVINLVNSRHPILEVQDDLNFIPNDVSMNNENSNFSIITGPNMGGKSTFIRQIGVIALMAQIGCFVPADEGAILPIFDSILSRVGAGDSQLKGLSTFMIEMLETSSILSNSTHNSLIIIDELGRGTSTYDGFGLAYSISEYIVKEKKCFTVFATHFHELTELSKKHATIKNLQVKALIENNDDLTLIYKVEEGISSKSFGINVAELVKFPEKIINMAKRKASELNDLENQDEYIKLKKTKCSNEEINQGIENLNKILVDWKQQCFKDNKLVYGVDESIEKLKQLSNNDDKFLKEIISLL